MSSDILFDIHVHSDISPCSSLSLERLQDKAQAKGLDGVCITDHNSMAARQWIGDGRQPNGLLIIIGQEYTTRQGDFLLFGPYESLPAGLSAEQLLQHVRSTGGAAIAAHPFRSDRPVAPEILRSGLCRLMERDNGRNTAGENEMAQAWLRTHPLSSLGGSDAHSLEELGRVRVRFKAPILCREDLIRALNESYRQALQTERLNGSF